MNFNLFLFWKDIILRTLFVKLFFKYDFLLCTFLATFFFFFLLKITTMRLKCYWVQAFITGKAYYLWYAFGSISILFDHKLWMGVLWKTDLLFLLKNNFDACLSLQKGAITTLWIKFSGFFCTSNAYWNIKFPVIYVYASF